MKKRKEPEPFADPLHPGNSSAFHTGKKCIEPGCTRPPGTAWSPYWCFEHNVERIQRIDKSVKQLVVDAAAGIGQIPAEPRRKK